MNKYNQFLSIVIISTLLIMSAFGSNQNIIIIPIIFIVMRILFTRDVDEKMMYLLYFLPFSVVLKLSPNSISFYSLFQVVYLIAIIYKKRMFSVKYLVSLTIFIIYIILISFDNSPYPWNFIVKNMIWLTILYFSLHFRGDQTFKNYTIAYVLGLIVSSLFGLFIDKIPRIYDYVIVSTIYITSNDALIMRFSGLWNDPNMLALLILIGISLLFGLYDSKQLNLFEFLLIIGLLIMFGLMTLSKMFLLGLTFIVVMYVFIKTKVRIDKGITFALIFIILAFIIISISPTRIIETYIYRFFGFFDGNLTIDQLTTNRTLIWRLYYDSFVSSGTWLFGNGLNAKLPFGRAAHNTIIEMFYLVGTFGFIIYVTIVNSFVKSALLLNNFRYEKKFASFLIPSGVLLWGLVSLDLYKHDFAVILLMLSLLGFIESKNSFGR